MTVSVARQILVTSYRPTKNKVLVYQNDTKCCRREGGYNSVNVEQGCSNTELRIVGYSNKLVHLTSRITTLSRKQHLASIHFSSLSYGQNLRFYTSTPGISRPSLKN